MRGPEGKRRQRAVLMTDHEWERIGARANVAGMPVSRSPRAASRRSSLRRKHGPHGTTSSPESVSGSSPPGCARTSSTIAPAIAVARHPTGGP